MTAYVATFALVFLRAIQQQNVMGRHYIAAALTSFAMAAAEVAVVLVVIDKSWQAVPWIGAGGATGVVAAIYSHNKIKELFSRG